jgi:hypothetical protein
MCGFYFCQDGVVHLQGLLHSVFGNKWLRLMRAPESATMPLVELLGEALREGVKLKSLFWQLIVFCGLALDKLVSDGPENSHAAESVTVNEKSNDQPICQSQLDSALVKAWSASTAHVASSEPVKLLSFCTDKASVGGLPLQSSYFTVEGSNVVMQAFPQAPRTPPRDHNMSSVDTIFRTNSVGDSDSSGAPEWVIVIVFWLFSFVKRITYSGVFFFSRS